MAVLLEHIQINIVRSLQELRSIFNFLHQLNLPVRGIGIVCPTRFGLSKYLGCYIVSIKVTKVYQFEHDVTDGY